MPPASNRPPAPKRADVKAFATTADRINKKLAALKPKLDAGKLLRESEVSALKRDLERLAGIGDSVMACW